MTLLTSLFSKYRAWSPFTPGGLAAFASAPLSRLFRWQALAALFVAGSFVWSAQRTWGTALEEALRNLPATGQIRSGRLEWNGEPEVRLAGSSFLGLLIDMDGNSQYTAPSDVEIKLTRDEIRLRSLLGTFSFPYRRGWNVALDRTELVPWWTTWKTPALLAVGILSWLALWLLWLLVAIPYSWFCRFVAALGRRSLTPGQAWILAGAAQITGGIIFGVALLGYTFGQVDWIRLLWSFLLTFPITWFFLAASPFRRPRIVSPEQRAAIGANPFSPAPEAGPPASNPFQRKL